MFPIHRTSLPLAPLKHTAPLAFMANPEAPYEAFLFEQTLRGISREQDENKYIKERWTRRLSLLSESCSVSGNFKGVIWALMRSVVTADRAENTALLTKTTAKQTRAVCEASNALHLWMVRSDSIFSLSSCYRWIRTSPSAPRHRCQDSPNRSWWVLLTSAIKVTERREVNPRITLLSPVKIQTA